MLIVTALSRNASMEQNPSLGPGHYSLDPVYRNLQIIFSFIILSCKIITAERAQQQGQEEIQDLEEGLSRV